MNEQLQAAALETLESTPNVLESILRPLPPWVLEEPADAGWSPKDVISHLLLSEEVGALTRIRAIVLADRPVLQGYDETSALERSGFRAWDADKLLWEFARKRAEDVAWLRSLKEDAFVRLGWHTEVGSVTAEELLFHAAHHDCEHLMQLLQMLRGHYEPLRGAMRVF